MPLSILPSASCRFDVVSLGECMIRLSPPGHDRLESARQLEVFVGGGEYNVTYALARLGLRCSWIGGLVDNALGRIVENHARAAGLDTSHCVRMKYDGVGREARIGLNFTEVGTSVRGSVTLYDRGYSATSRMKPGDVDLSRLFESERARWFHTGGIFTCLSKTTAELARAALAAAKKGGAVVSYDLNFRSKLWTSELAIATTRPLMPFVDCLIGNEEDFQKVLGYPVEGAGESLRGLKVESYQKMVRKVARDFPNLALIGTTLREVRSGLVNDWSAILYSTAEDRFYLGPKYENLEIEDRVGGGDGFASGVIYGLLTGESLQRCVDLGTAHGALLQTTRGDTSQVTLPELLHVAGGGGARIQR